MINTRSILAGPGLMPTAISPDFNNRRPGLTSLTACSAAQVLVQVINNANSLRPNGYLEGEHEFCPKCDAEALAARAA